MSTIRFKKGSIFHVFNKSISDYNIFNKYCNGLRFINGFYYYNTDNKIKTNFSLFLKNNSNFIFPSILAPKEDALVKILAYCIMPDHYHFLVKILVDDVFSKLMSDVENSYSRNFNKQNNRLGPLWQSSFKSVEIKNNSQLTHVHRYIHLNPTTKGLVAKPEVWKLSSYREFINIGIVLKEWITEVSIKSPQRYKQFVENQIDYQKQLRIIKKLLFD